MSRARTFALSLILLAVAGVAQASWYDDYDAGLNAARAGNWSVVVQRMSAAIKGNPKEQNKAKTYGTIFINYHPFYYRGVAYLQLGKYEQAVADFEQASGPGPENLGSIEMLMDSAKTKLRLAEASTPAPQPEPVKPTPTPVPATPAAPAIDPALRQRANSALNATKGKLQAAQQRKQLATTMPKNAWIWALLGASQYSQYAFEADPSYRKAALKSFQNAKQHRKWKDGLPSQYFSKRIRRASSETEG